MPEISVSLEGIARLGRDTNGPIAAAVYEYAFETVYMDALMALSAKEAPPGYVPGLPLNPPPGPPRRRSSRLFDSINVVPPHMTRTFEGEVVALLVSDRDYVPYYDWLRGADPTGGHPKGPYRFLPDDSKYTYREI